jgi:stage V sporulation protein R
MNLTPELNYIRHEIEGYAREYGLDAFEVIFELLEFDEMNEIAAYGGFPTRYPHWRWGMEYDHLSKGYAYGLQKIYEMVINNDPCYAYLLKGNAMVDQKIVMSHVFGHADFFKNNYWFSRSNRKMMDEIANHATRMNRYIAHYGRDRVETFTDQALSLENLIDYHAPFITRKETWLKSDLEEPKEETPHARRLKSKPYMESFINPAAALRAEEERIKEKTRLKKKSFPEEPEKDVLFFLQEYAPLERWERDVLSIIREEAYYYAPQGQTKIMNEGWAAYWHSKIMTEKALTDSEIIDYADHHSGTLSSQPGVINPYKIGIELFRDIEDRWNRGKFGKEYDECDDRDAKRLWDKNLGLGRDKIFEARRVHNDVTFIDTFLTPEFVEEQRLFVYGFDKSTGNYVIIDRDFKSVKQKLLFGLTNCGQPHIEITDANYKNRGELYLKHRHEGVDLKHDWAIETLKNLERMWQRPVHIETVVEGKGKLISFDGSQVTEENLKVETEAEPRAPEQ